MRVQIIGYGNELRGDDAAGPLVVEQIERWHLPHVTTLACRQLTPELTTLLAEADQVVFIDAYPCDDTNRQVQLREITPTSETELNNHQSDPHALLMLTQILHGRSPRAWWLLIPAERCEHGVELSPITRAGVRTAAEMVSILIPAIGLVG